MDLDRISAPGCGPVDAEAGRGIEHIECDAGESRRRVMLVSAARASCGVLLAIVGTLHHVRTRRPLCVAGQPPDMALEGPHLRPAWALCHSALLAYVRTRLFHSTVRRKADSKSL